MRWRGDGMEKWVKLWAGRVGLCWEEGGGVGLAVKELGDPGPWAVGGLGEVGEFGQ